MPPGLGGRERSGADAVTRALVEACGVRYSRRTPRMSLVAKSKTARRRRKAALLLSRLSPAGSSPRGSRKAEFVTRIIRLIVSGWKCATWGTTTPGETQVRKTGEAESSAFASARGPGDGQ